jgi:peroxin-13
MYGGMGGMGGYGMGGMGGYGMGGMGGMGMDPNDPQSLTHSFSQSTQATFQIIESIVGAFGGFAQMLESTYMATHSSFFGMSPFLFPLYPSSTPSLLPPPSIHHH